jgi:exodeoxyribonuclease III
VEIISWNVNSVRARLPRVAALLARRQPDLVCLQEIKVSSQDFPVAEFAALGYASPSESAWPHC